MNSEVKTPDRVLSSLGLAKRAGKTVTGTELVQDAVRSGKAKIIIAASDISQGSKKKLINTCEYYKTELIEYSNMQQLAAALGIKKLITSVAVTDENFKILIKKQLSVMTEND